MIIPINVQSVQFMIIIITTGSGKTYSVFGPPVKLTEIELNRAKNNGLLVPASWGIFPRVAIELFQMGQIQSFQVSVVEVYQNRVFDLLNQRKVLNVGVRSQTQGRDLGKGKCHPSSCFCRNCFEMQQNKSTTNLPALAKRQTMQFANDVAKLARRVEVSRTSKGHLLNDRSSRSHCLVQIYLSMTHNNKTLSSSFFICGFSWF